MKIEDKCFEIVATNVHTPCSSLVISDTILKKFKYWIQQGREIFTVDNQVSPRFLYSDLRLLVGQHWLIFEVIETFVKIFNRSESNFTNIYNFFYVVDLETNGMLKEEIIDWKAKSIDRICIIVNVGSDILGNTFIANSKQRGNHWICFFIDITKAKSYYYDSLGWKIPPNLNKKENSSSRLLKTVNNVPLGAFFLKVFIVKKHTVGRPKNAIKSANKMLLCKV